MGTLDKGIIAQQNDTKDAFTESRERPEVEAAFQKTLDPTAGSPATRKFVAGIINLFVDDLFGTGGNEMEQRVFLTRLRKDFHVLSEDWNDVAFAGQTSRWTQDSQNGPYIEVNQNKAIDEEWEEIPVERNTKGDLHCTPSMHTMYRSPLGKIKLAAEQDTVPMLLQFFQMCVDGSFSNNWRCQVSLNKMARLIKSQPVKLRYWPLTGSLRKLGFPDASCTNNDDVSSQRGMTACTGKHHFGHLDIFILATLEFEPKHVNVMIGKHHLLGAAQIQRVNDPNGDHRVPGSHHSHGRAE